MAIGLIAGVSVLAVGGLAAAASLAEEDAPAPASAPVTTAAPVRPTERTTPRTTLPPATPAPTVAAPTTVVEPPTEPPTTLAPAVRVVAVVDGDTVDLSTGERVRIIGIDTPERGQPCFAEASVAMADLVMNQVVTVSPGARDDRDTYGRLLRYVDVNGVDAGKALIERGLAIARFDSRDGYGSHPREAEYVAADEASAPACVPPTTLAPTPEPTVAPTPVPIPVPAPAPTPPAAVAPPVAAGGNCHPSYTPCVPIDDDVDCAGGRGNGPSYVRGPIQVIGPDEYGLDNDGDGIGCESG